MYEIWLAMNIVWEIALGVMPLLLLAGLVWIAAVVATARHPAAGQWRRAVPGALVIGAIVALLAAVSVPGMSKSSLAELSYWVDWAALAATAMGLGALAALFVWPMLAMRMRPR